LFSFFDAGQYTFADKIEIRNTTFREITGTVLKMNREVDNRGIYNGEYITITDSHFENVGGAIADIYRCCNDESTFGPHFTMSSSHVANTGNDERNPTVSSIRLLGAQVINIDDNDFVGSKPVLITETVGEPVTTFGDNRFVDTPEPEIQSIAGE
jgi:poly(beta-D-mannuronate) lyase